MSGRAQPETLPLGPRPDLDEYRKLAKDLVSACASADPNALRAWSAGWIERLTGHSHLTAHQIDETARRLEESARQQMTAGECTLTMAQCVVARAHGFESWPKFEKFVKALSDPDSTVAAFEAAASAVVHGDLDELRRLLRAHPGLVRARSSREHGAMLLHYVSANGVESCRQLSPKNSAEIAKALIDVGADVNATADMYNGKCTALGLVATSVHPSNAGVQREVMDVLLEHGARMDLRGSAGYDALLVRGCLANGQPAAAAYLASRGAPLDLEGAAGLGRLEDVRRLMAAASGPQRIAAFRLACVYGSAPVVDCLLSDGGVGVDTELEGHGGGCTGLHLAAFHGQLEAVNVLLKRGADIHAIDSQWKRPPLAWALTGRQQSGHAGKYDEVIARLVQLGAQLPPETTERRP